MASQFPKLFHQYYAIHEAISRILLEIGAEALDENEIEQRLMALYPDMELEPTTLKAAIRQALKDSEATVGRPILSDCTQPAGH
jgi:hypothetical protein